MESSEGVVGISFMRTNCKVCKSPHRAEIERMKALENKTYKEIMDYAKANWNENLNFMNLSRHFNSHFLPIVTERAKSSRLAMELANKKTEDAIKLLSELENNLIILKKSIEMVFSKGVDSRDKVAILRTLLSEVRLTVESISKLKQDFNIEVSISPEEELKKLINILKYLNLTPEQLSKLDEILVKEKLYGITTGESSQVQIMGQ